MNYTTNFSDKLVKFKEIKPGDIFFIYDKCLNKHIFYIKATETDNGENAFGITDNYIVSFSDNVEVSVPESFELKINI